MKHDSQKGAVMVEATIYLPLVICSVMAMIYYGLFIMQQNALMAQVDRIAGVAAREEAYPGYDVFGMNAGGAVDFSWGGNTPSAGQVKEYYTSRHERFSDLYREIFGMFCGSRADYESRLADAAEAVTMIRVGSIGAPEVEIKKSFLGASVTVTITHHIPLPGVLRYFGLEDATVRAVRTKNIVNPSEFVRNTDLAVDLVEYLLEKLDPGGTISGYIAKTQELIQKIL